MMSTTGLACTFYFLSAYARNTAFHPNKSMIMISCTSPSYRALGFESVIWLIIFWLSLEMCLIPHAAIEWYPRVKHGWLPCEHQAAAREFSGNCLDSSFSWWIDSKMLYAAAAFLSKAGDLANHLCFFIDKLLDNYKRGTITSKTVDYILRD